MYKDRRILAVITARGGSKGLPRKNIKPLLGKPLIAWTIEKALASNYLDRIIVSTDDKEIAEIAKNSGAEVPFLRPNELAGDHANSVDVAIHAINFMKDRGEQFDYIALLEPTSPLRKDGDIDRAIETLVDAGDSADSLVSLGKITLEHPWVAKKIEKHGYMVSFVENAENVVRRQELKDAFFPYGVIYLSSIHSLFHERTFYPKRTIPLFIERWQCYEIDDIYDFIAVEAILGERLLKKEKG
ncbi:MAG: acylneuraminate cytidylyltransferase family protein [Syntrophorhabdaceae bacterium]|nr:acylneuraminate cytidylyltransferase family protein [Syntrophorhabdaceae bacterium]MDD5242405.1 acylneuraminate cytidylyltransferase family protein [Syntrophorhabdaceae bacterium]